ncbi:helix-turn-helix transcriptional regulator [Ilumatobacter nonamiensis]|uniref:helix-turn-helix transcriptional regulator n=1 Tax=Ilumatobacter nonamiensis TaxID=467093 RepID=UPI000345CAE4|nr:helix-turn-helix domain-containing protein [Ilumatobacter nonamiensis]
MDAVAIAPSPTQQRVLIEVKRRGETTADALADALDISASAARQHLAALRAGGFIEARRERSRRGRPADRYHATELADPYLTTPDSTLSLDLLDHMADEDPDLVRRVFDRRRRRLVDDARPRLDGASADDRIAIVTELLDAQGYLADCERVDASRYRIHLHHCAMWPVAQRYRQACSSEIDFLSDLLPEATVRRVVHKTAGAHECAYDVLVGT